MPKSPFLALPLVGKSLRLGAIGVRSTWSKIALLTNLQVAQQAEHVAKPAFVSNFSLKSAFKGAYMRTVGMYTRCHHAPLQLQVD